VNKTTIMGMFNFLAAGNSLKGLVSRRFRYANEGNTMIPNFGLKPEVADRLRDVRETRRREDPFSRRNEVLDREIKQRLQTHSGPRVRSTYRPERPVAKRVEPEAARPVEAISTARENIAPPAPGNGAGWVRKLKIARRVSTRPVETGKRAKRQPKRPSVYRGTAAARHQREPQWMAGA
jgi:hypothetical protein